MTNWTTEQTANAQTIVNVGLEMGMNSRAIMIALMAAMQESSLMNLSGGDRDSVGLFQQRPSQGWGTVGQIMNPIYAATKFYQALQKVPNYQNLQPGAAAQAVQRSAFPLAYNQWQGDAQRLLINLNQKSAIPWPPQIPQADLSQITNNNGQVPGSDSNAPAGVEASTSDSQSPTGVGSGASTDQASLSTSGDLSGFPNLANLLGQGQSPSGASGARGEIISAAEGQLGVPYVWGGTTPGVGLDCSGLVQYALGKAGIKAPRIAADQLAMKIGQSVGTDLSQLQPGDLIGMENGGHIGIYLGNGKYIEAPHTGENVKIAELSQRTGGWWGVHLNIPGTATSSYGDMNLSDIGNSGFGPVTPFAGAEAPTGSI